jgi:uncharacterized iron-regulated protein
MNAAPTRHAAALIWLLLALAAPSPARADASLTLLDLARSRSASLTEFVPDLAKADLILVGESHGNPLHHQAQLAVIRALHEAGRPVAVGLEMFQRREQPVLDRWVAGGLTEADMAHAFFRNWNIEWEAYRDIFVYCRDNGIPMAGLNVPREITRKVAREGFAALNPEEIGLLPPITCSVDPQYEDFLRGFAGSSGHEEAFDRFCQAQLVWDAAMAVHALDFLKGRPGRTMVVLTGSVHAWKPAVPDQARRLAPQAAVVSILPGTGVKGDRSEIGTADADYLIPDR